MFGLYLFEGRVIPIQNSECRIIRFGGKRTRFLHAAYGLSRNDNIGVWGGPSAALPSYPLLRMTILLETLEHYTLKTLNEKSIVIGREMR